MRSPVSVTLTGEGNAITKRGSGESDLTWQSLWQCGSSLPTYGELNRPLVVTGKRRIIAYAFASALLNGLGPNETRKRPTVSREISCSCMGSAYETQTMGERTLSNGNIQRGLVSSLIPASRSRTFRSWQERWGAASYYSPMKIHWRPHRHTVGAAIKTIREDSEHHGKHPSSHIPACVRQVAVLGGADTSAIASLLGHSSIESSVVYTRSTGFFELVLKLLKA